MPVHKMCLNSFGCQARSRWDLGSWLFTLQLYKGLCLAGRALHGRAHEEALQLRLCSVISLM